VDAAGEIFIGELFNSRVRKVGANGIIVTEAGTGRPGYSGDGGPPNAASLWYPYGVAPDSFGNLYIVDGAENRIRKVTNAQAPATGQPQ
jgi:hypothetical protein